MKRLLLLIVIVSTILSLLITSLSCEQSTGPLKLMITSFNNSEAERAYEAYGESSCICGNTFVFTVTVERTRDTIFNQVYIVSMASGGKTRDSQDVVFTLDNQGPKTLELSVYNDQMSSDLMDKCEEAQAAYDDFEAEVGWKLLTGQASSLSYDEVKKLMQQETNLLYERNRWKALIRGQGGYDTESEFDKFCRKYVQLSVTQKSEPTHTPTSVPTTNPTNKPTTLSTPTSAPTDTPKPTPIPTPTPSPTPKPTPIMPIITNVSKISATQTQTITIQGEGFGNREPYRGNSPYIEIIDVTTGMHAGHDANWVEINVAQWNDSQIIISGFVGSYGGPGRSLHIGDQIQINVWNAQSGLGPAVYTVICSSP